MESSDKTPENFENALTGIRATYTLASTPAQNGGEADQLIIENFIKSLAEVAVNIASRRKNHEQTGKQESNN